MRVRAIFPPLKEGRGRTCRTPTCEGADRAMTWRWLRPLHLSTQPALPPCMWCGLWAVAFWGQVGFFCPPFDWHRKGCVWIVDEFVDEEVLEVAGPLNGLVTWPGWCGKWKADSVCTIWHQPLLGSRGLSGSTFMFCSPGLRIRTACGTTMAWLLKLRGLRRRVPERGPGCYASWLLSQFFCNRLLIHREKTATPLHPFLLYPIHATASTISKRLLTFTTSLLTISICWWGH